MNLNLSDIAQVKPDRFYTGRSRRSLLPAGEKAGGRFPFDLGSLHARSGVCGEHAGRTAAGRWLPEMRRLTLLRGEDTDGATADNGRQAARRVAGTEEGLEA